MNVVVTPAMLGQVIVSGILAGSLYAMVALGLGALDKSGIAELTYKGRGGKKQK